MKTMTKVLMAAAVLVVALSLSAPVGANCGGTPIITTIDATGTTFVFNPTFAEHPSFGYGAYGPYTYSLDPANPTPLPLSAAASISFWGAGAGDPAVGFGNDNGAYDMIAAGGFYFSGYPPTPTYGGYVRGGVLNGTWEGGTDNCVGANNCMCVLFSDQDGTDGFFAIAGAMSDSTISTSFNQGGADGNGNNLPIQLVRLDAPSITGSVRDAGTFDVNLDVTVAAPAGGNYVQDGCSCGPAGFMVSQMILPRGNTMPDDRAAAAWADAPLSDGSPQGVTPFGQTVTVRSACGASNSDVYLATKLVFDSDFGTAVVSSDSTRVECGPTLADPGSNRPQPGDRPGRDRPRPRKR
jgi:hypothetical protein